MNAWQMIGLETVSFLADPWWLVLAKALFAFVLLLVLTLFVVVFERKLVGRMQNRYGPNQTGPFGTLQSLADGMKLMFKEDFTPKGADKLVYNLAPFILAVPAITAFSVIPFAGAVPLPWGGKTNLQVADTPVSVLFIVAIAAVGAYGLVLAGWSSGSTYPLLGGLRSTAQVISYEVAMGLSLVAVFLQAGSMSTSQIVEAQSVRGQTFFGVGPDISLWYAVTLFPSFVIYVISMVGETNRAPFDMPEAEGELVAGFATEYSAMKYAMFFMAEYMNMITVSALATTLFLGGYRAPLPFNLIPGLDEGWWGLLWFVVKVVCFLAFFVWLRGTLPRVRYDQLMHLGWKILIPASLAWILIVASFRVVALEGVNALSIVIVAVVAAAILAVYFRRLSNAEADDEAKQRDRRPARRFNAFAGGYPVPPMAGQEVVDGPTVLKASTSSFARPGAAGTATLERSEWLEDEELDDEYDADEDYDEEYVADELEELDEAELELDEELDEEIDEDSKPATRRFHDGGES